MPKGHQEARDAQCNGSLALRERFLEKVKSKLSLYKMRKSASPRNEQIMMAKETA